MTLSYGSSVVQWSCHTNNQVFDRYRSGLSSFAGENTVNKPNELNEPNEPNELDEALKECGFTITNDGVAKLTDMITVEITGGPLGMFFVRATFRNGRTLFTTFSWDDIDDAFPWKAFVAGSEVFDKGEQSS
jgi:hypothetical protein